METLFFFGGLIVGTGLSYLWFIIGRNTGYQDKNIVPPPAPIQINKPKPPVQIQRGMIDDLTDPSLANVFGGGEE